MKQVQLYLYFMILILLLAFSGCKPGFVSEKTHRSFNEVIVKADDDLTLTISQVYEMLYDSRLLTKGGVLDTNMVRHFIDSLMTDSLTGIEARSIDLTKHYNQYRIFKLRYYDFLIRQYLKKEVYDKVEVDSLEIVDFYFSRPDLFLVEDQVNLYHIALTTNILLNGNDSLKYRKMSPESLDSAMAIYADSIKGLITSPEKFTDVAREHSEDEVVARQGGYLGWTKRNVHPHPFDSVAFSLEKGEVGGPYTDNNGWHIIMIDDRFDRGIPPLNPNLYIAATKSLKTTKSNEIGKKLFDSLFADYNVEVNEEILDKNLYLVDGQTWVAIVNGQDTIDCNEARSMEISYRNKFNVDNTTPEMKREMFNTIGEKYVVVQAARNIGLEQESGIMNERAKIWNKYAKTIIDDKIYDVVWKPSDSLIEAYYNEHIDEFKVTKPYKVQQIIVSDSVFGEFLRDQAMSGYDFIELAKEHYPGEESIRQELADLGYIGPTDVSEEFYEVASKTPVGEVSHPVKTEFGYHIIKMVEIKEAQNIGKARQTIIPLLKDEHRKTTYENYKRDIFEKYNVQYLGNLYPIHLKPKELRN